MTRTKPKVFDADKRAQEREDAGLRLAGNLYPRARRNNGITRQLRAVARRQQDTQEQIEAAEQTMKIDRITAQIAAAEKSGDNVKVQALETQVREVRANRDHDEIDRLNEEAEHQLFETLALLLGPATDGGTLSADELADGLDFEDASDLAQALMGVEDDEEPDTDPS